MTVGKKYGDFRVIEEDKGMAIAICTQGHLIQRRINDLKKTNRANTCRECHNMALVDEIIGEKFGEFTVTSLNPNQDFTKRPSHWKFLCECNCGRVRSIRKCDLTTIKTECKRCRTMKNWY